MRPERVGMRYVKLVHADRDAGWALCVIHQVGAHNQRYVKKGAC
jgi:hypothetical protein